MARIAGEANADFLPITSDRTGFIKDSPEYNAFRKVMERVTGDVKKILQKLSGKKEGRKVSRALKEALQKIYKALAANPNLSPFGAFPLGDEAKGIGGAAGMVKETVQAVQTVPADQPPKATGPKKKRKKKPKVKQLTPNAVIKRMKFGDIGVSICVDSFGEDGAEVFSEETTIYVNRDHPLYKRESAKIDTHILNLARLITQEISLMKDPTRGRRMRGRAN